MYSGRRVLLIGYGALGSELLVDLEAAGASVVAILDDRFEELGAEPRVQGPISELATVLSDFEVDLLVVGALHARDPGTPLPTQEPGARWSR